MSFFLNAAALTATAERTTPEDLEVNSTDDLQNVDTGTLVKLYNKAVPSATIKKFVNRATAIARTYPLLESMARAPEETPEDTSDPWGMASGNAPEPPPAPTPGKQEEEGEESTTKEDTVATATKKRKGSSGAKGKTRKGPSNGKRGRTASYAGAKLFRVGDENPCRSGGLRAKSWDLIRNGMTYEAYLEKGGRPQELAFNVRQGRVKVEPAKKSAD